MKITQVFRSSSDERVISELTIGGADQATRSPSRETTFAGLSKIEFTQAVSNPGSFPTALLTKLALNGRMK